jgi:hypothetical protein
MDFLASHDLEDSVAVIDGTSTMLKEIGDSPRWLPVTCVMHSTCDCYGDYGKRHWVSPAFTYRVMAVTSERRQ